jgi:hypothetical protein
MTLRFQDLRYALRLLRKSPGSTTVTVLTPAPAANSAIFTVANALLLKILHVVVAEEQLKKLMADVPA